MNTTPVKEAAREIAVQTMFAVWQPHISTGILTYLCSWRKTAETKFNANQYCVGAWHRFDKRTRAHHCLWQNNGSRQTSSKTIQCWTSCGTHSPNRIQNNSEWDISQHTHSYPEQLDQTWKSFFSPHIPGYSVPQCHSFFQVMHAACAWLLIKYIIKLLYCFMSDCEQDLIAKHRWTHSW